MDAGLTRANHFSHDHPNMAGEETARFRSYLENLTTQELIKLADHSGIDIPPELDRLFIIRELLENKFEEDLSEPLLERPDLVTASLPKQYHITFLEVLLRDPQWAYVFWEIKAQDREHYEHLPQFEGYELRILEIKESKVFESFTVSVGMEDNSWYLGFPPRGGTFQVALWVKEPALVLASSRPFVLPRFLNGPGSEEILAKPLVQLSGAEDFAVLRTADRFSRLRL
jgi:hypothetical protein